MTQDLFNERDKKKEEEPRVADKRPIRKAPEGKKYFRCDCTEDMKYLSKNINGHNIYYCKVHDCLRVPENGD